MTETEECVSHVSAESRWSHDINRRVQLCHLLHVSVLAWDEFFSSIWEEDGGVW